MIRGFTLTRDILIRVVPIVLVMVLAVLLLGQCEKRREAAAKERVATEQGKSATASGRDAVETVGKAAARERASDDLSTTNEREIKNANGANVAVDPDGVGRAGLDSLCRRSAYRDSQRCRLRQPTP